MSHSTFPQTNSTKASEASNVSPLQPSGSTTMKLKPVAVLINWSESKRFNDGQQFDFEIFEAIALKAALDNPLGGYDKTNITVTFDNGHAHQCRIDLGCGGNECGFTDHCLQILEYAKSLLRSDPTHWYLHDPESKNLLDMILGYQLDPQLVMVGRCMAKEKTAQAESKKEAEKKAKIAADQEQQRAHEKKLEEFHSGLVVPSWAQAVIVATYSELDEESSDPYGDYYQFKTTKTIILAWSKHTRRLFPELRKACKRQGKRMNILDI